MRRFEPPFTAEPYPQNTPDKVALQIRDGAGAPLAWVYGDDRATGDTKKLTCAEAEGVARAIVRGLELVAAERRR